MADEAQRFYRAISKPIASGEHRGRQVAFSFRNDNMTLAADHAWQCFQFTPYGRLETGRVMFLGTVPPDGMGEFILI